MNHSSSTTFTEAPVLPRWWSWRWWGWSLWLRTGSSTAPWRWREARNSRPTRQKPPSQRKGISIISELMRCLFTCYLDLMSLIRPLRQEWDIISTVHPHRPHPTHYHTSGLRYSDIQRVIHSISTLAGPSSLHVSKNTLFPHFLFMPER